MTKAVSTGILAITVALLVLHAAMTTSTPVSISSIRAGYSFELNPDVPVATEASDVNLKRVLLIDAVMRTSGKVICAEEPSGNLLHRFCEDDGEDDSMENHVPNGSARWARFEFNITRHAISLPTPSAKSAVYALTRWDDLSIRR